MKKLRTDGICGWLPQTAGSRRRGLVECTLENVALANPPVL